jgi:hypothetical protein
MLRSISNLEGYAISASDGELGTVNEFYIDDHTWSIRYAVVETGSWLFNRKVLIPHAALGKTDWEAKTFKVNLTMDQVRNSPDFESKQTVSRQHEIQLLKHYALAEYWKEGFYAGPIGLDPLPEIFDAKTVKDVANPTQEQVIDSHLRSTKNIKGYHIHAIDGEIGHLEDFVVDDENWALAFLIVDTHNWLPGKKVLISPQWIKFIDWEEAQVYVNLSKASVRDSPEFNPCKMIGKEYVHELFHHYEICKD